jgi:hypothetical protein
MAQGQINAQQLAQISQMMEQRKVLFDQQQQAHQTALRGLQNQGAVLGDVFGAPPQPPAPGVSSPPGTTNGGQPPPGGSAQGGGVVPPAAPPAPPPPDPWKSIQQSTQGMGGQGMSPQAAGMTPQLGSPPPPAQPQGQPQGDVKNGVSQVPDPQEMMRKIVAAGKARNLPDEEIGRLVQDLYPTLASMQKQRVDEFRAEVQSMLGAMRGQAAITNAGAAVTRAETGQQEHERKVEADKSKKELNDARRKKLERALSGTGGEGAVKIVKWKDDADGNTVGGFDRAGHFHKIDEDTPKTSPKAAANRTRDVAGLREDRRSLIMRGLSPTDPKIKALDDQITAAEKAGTKPASGGAKHQKGDVVQAGGKSYKVVGFDKDGEPLVEPVQ